MTECEEYDPLTHPKYTIGGCPGCGHCRIFSDGDVICTKEHIIVETTVPDVTGDKFVCKGYERISKAFDFGCLSCKGFSFEDDKCMRNYKHKKLIIRIG